MQETKLSKQRQRCHCHCHEESEGGSNREGECRPSRQITQSGSRHSNSAKVELARSDHSNRELVSWKERGRGERKEGKKLSRECIALLKREECLARLASLSPSATTTIIMMAMGAARSFVPVFSFVLFLSPSTPLLRSFTFLHLRGAHFFGPRRRRLLGRFKKKSRNFIWLRTTR